VYAVANCVDRDKLREHNQLSEEISNAITSTNLGEPVDEIDLEEELEQMQQEQLDEQMLKSGTVPVSDAINRMPAAANGESKRIPSCIITSIRIYPANISTLVAGKKQPAAIEEDDEEAELRKLQAEMAM
jgi:charged multivesicular body protein 4A/B